MRETSSKKGCPLSAGFAVRLPQMWAAPTWGRDASGGWGLTPHAACGGPTTSGAFGRSGATSSGLRFVGCSPSRRHGRSSVAHIRPHWASGTQAAARTVTSSGRGTRSRTAAAQQAHSAQRPPPPHCHLQVLASARLRRRLVPRRCCRSQARLPQALGSWARLGHPTRGVERNEACDPGCPVPDWHEQHREGTAAPEKARRHGEPDDPRGEIASCVREDSPHPRLCQQILP